MEENAIPFFEIFQFFLHLLCNVRWGSGVVALGSFRPPESRPPSDSESLLNMELKSLPVSKTSVNPESTMKK